MSMHSNNPFSLLQRENGVYYVRFKNPDEASKNRYLTAKSTGEKDYSKAMAKAWQMYTNNEHEKQSIALSLKKNELSDKDIEELLKLATERGIIKGCIKPGTKQDVVLADFLTDFWDIDKSEFLKEKARMGRHIGINYCKESRNQIIRHWKPFFENMLLGEITKAKLKEFVLHIQTLPCSAGTKLHIYRAGSIGLKWAYNNELIDKDITAGIITFSVKPKERKILTKELATLLFSIEWNDEKAKLANMLAMLTGMRQGEILALRKMDLGKNCIYVNHSWNEHEKLKSTKNGEKRIVYFPFPQLTCKLLELVGMNPFDDSMQAFIFWGTIPGKPIDCKVLITNLRLQLYKIGITNQESKEYTFHGWRHFYTSYMADIVNQRALQSQTGHKTIEMLEHYSNHQIESDIDQIQQAQLAIFGDIVNKSKEISFDKIKLYDNVKNLYLDKTPYFEHTHQRKNNLKNISGAILE